MQGYDVLWLPGMDHAGLRSQAVVENKLREEGKTRYDLGREKFIETIWDWKEEYANVIRSQWEKLGLGLDYSRERFTLDESLSNAVKEVFVKLYEKGLIYRGEYIINWDPETKTALSDIEVIYEEVQGKFYHMYYPIIDSDETIEIATTRPETIIIIWGGTRKEIHTTSCFNTNGDFVFNVYEFSRCGLNTIKRHTIKFTCFMNDLRGLLLDDENLIIIQNL